jgi:hypothetical protein
MEPQARSRAFSTRYGDIREPLANFETRFPDFADARSGYLLRWATKIAWNGGGNC